MIRAIGGEEDFAVFPNLRIANNDVVRRGECPLFLALHRIRDKFAFHAAVRNSENRVVIQPFNIGDVLKRVSGKLLKTTITDIGNHKDPVRCIADIRPG